MSNIHGFGDVERGGGGAAGGGASGGGPAQGYAQQDHSAPEGIPLTPPSNGLIPPISARLVPRFSVKTFTFFISMVDIIMMLATLIYAGATGQAVFAAQNAMGGPDSKVLYEMGGQWCGSTGYFTQSVPTGAVWRLFTPIVLHGGLMHLFSNLFFQMHFGFTFEKRWTTKRFIAIYIITGLGASLLSCLTHKGDDAAVSVGASGALFGLLGADMAYLVMNWNEIPMQKMEMIILVVIVAFNFLFSIAGSSTGDAESSDGFKPPNIDNWAHLGGLLTGIFCAPVICPVITVGSKTRLFQLAAGFVWVSFFFALSFVIFMD